MSQGNRQCVQDGIAIIGMTGRFPGAPNVDQFWRKLHDGESGISFFSDEELLAEGVPREVFEDPQYVRARGVLDDDVFGFDAKFFGFSSREADITDPQQRIFLECCWEALEDAAYAPSTFPGRIGLFGGSSWSTYFFDIYARPDLWRALGAFQITIGNEKDHLTTRVSYKLNLRGPSVTVQTACSSSLVAVAMACQSLAMRESDMALAGGVSISVPQKIGYLYQEGAILCPDGHCRAFDAEAQGTVGGNGVAVVVLKRLAEAIADGDRIRAVIRGWAVNNDGSAKVGYTAPSIEGQAAAIAAAHALAGISPDTISYVEAHGTGTPLGDPIEVAALIDAFRRGTDRVGYCAIGSVKTNIGHLDAAAGIVGLVKTTLSLENRTIPASLHFRTPNPVIPLASSPFFVNAERREWSANGAPRRAGVSSFGIGGTNAHVVVEEAPPAEASGPSRPDCLIVLSAQTESALTAASSNLAAHIAAHPDQSLADVAYTLQAGRTPFPHRRAIVCRTAAEAVEALSGRDGVLSGLRDAEPPRVVFAFPGQGSQHAGMLSGLYDSEPAFAEEVDRLTSALDAGLGDDLRSILRSPSPELDIDQTRYAQPAIFIVEYALARLWMEWGIVPDMVIGHSVGEFTAACIAGVFSPEDAVRLVAERGKLMQALPRGKMLAVPLAEEQVKAIAGQELSLAAVNSADLSIVSGENGAVDRLARELRLRGVECRALHTSHAFHSAMMDPIVAPFTELVAAAPRHAPRLPLISNVSGTWIDAATATDASYWGGHVRQTVRYADGLSTVFNAGVRVLLEVGPGQTLTTLAGRHRSRQSDHLLVASGRHPEDRQPDSRALLTALARLWIAGAPVSWSGFAKYERRRRVSLPTYPFERRHHSIEPPDDEDFEVAAAPPLNRADVANWIYVPSWSRRPALAHGANGASKSWLLFADEEGFANALAARLADLGHQVTTATPGKRFARASDDRYVLAPADLGGYAALLEELQRAGRFPDAIAHCWSVTRESLPFARAQERGFHSLLSLCRALSERTLARSLPLSVVATNLFDVRGGEPVYPEKATLLGPCKVVPQEHSQLRFRIVDVDSSSADIVEELCSDIDDTVVAYRGNNRWVQTFEPWPLPRSTETALPRGGCYLITGGRGRIGMLIAEHLARNVGAKLVLVGRTAPSAELRGWADGLGVEVLNIAADAGNEAAMRKAIRQARARFGRIDGVVHAAGFTDDRGFAPVRETDARLAEEHFQAKATSLAILESLLRDDPPSLWLLVSSLSAILGGLGMAAYAGANAFLDAFATARNGNGARWLSVDWDGWDFANTASSHAVTPESGLDVLGRLISAPATPQVVVAVGDLHTRLEQWIALRSIRAPRRESTTAGAAEETATVADAGDDTERAIAAIWRELLGAPVIQPHDNFFELGGHSLLAIQLISRLRDLFHVEVAVQTIFEMPTVTRLARKIEAQRQEEEAARLERMVALVEGLSDDEINALLGSQGEQ